MESKSNQTPVYSPVCMIYSQWNLQELEGFFEQFGDYGNQHGPLRVVRAKSESGEWRDTNRTIVLVTKHLFDLLIKDGFHLFVRTQGRPPYDFRILPYEVRENNLPGEGFKKDLFIRIPKNLNLSTKEVEEVIHDKMAPLVKFGVIKGDQYSVKIPLRNKSRTTGDAFGSCFLAFNDSVTSQQAALVKAVIDDTFWGDSEETFHCFWARDQKLKPIKSGDVDKEDVKKIGKDKDGKKAFYKNEVVEYEEIPKKKVWTKKFPKN